MPSPLLKEFNTTDGLAIELEEIPAGVFILGTSLLGGTDVLSDAPTIWTSVASNVSNINISRGMTRDGIYRRIETGTCDLTFTTKTFDPWVNNSVRVGANMRVLAYPNGKDTITNLVPNPSFEYGTSSWSAVGATTLTSDSTKYVYGDSNLSTNKSLKVVCPATASVGAISAMIPISGNATYNASGFAYADLARSMSFIVYEYDASAALVQTNTYPFVGEGAWQTFELSLITNPATTQIQISVLNLTATVNTFWVDAIQVTAGSTRLPYFDGGYVHNLDTSTGWNAMGIGSVGVSWTTQWSGTSGNSATIATPVGSPLFAGEIETLSMSYDKNGWTNVTVSLVDATKACLNNRVAEYVSPGATDTANAVVTAAVAGTGLTPYSGNGAGQVATLGNFDVVETVAGDLITQAIDAEYGWFWIDKSNTQYICVGRDFIITTPTDLTFGNVSAESDTYLPIREIEVNLNTQEIANSIKVSSSWDTGATPVAVIDQDSIDFYGEVSADVNVYLYTGATGTDLTELTSWAANVPVKSASRRIDTVTVSAIDTNGLLNAMSDIAPATAAHIEFARTGYTIEDDYMVTRIHHNISLNEWLTTVELWKGN
jgi:hypothetical protein